MNIVSFFKGIGHALAGAFGVIKKVVPEEMMVAGLEFVKAAALKELDNSGKRAWVVGQIQGRFKVGESVARLVTELAVTQLKHGVDVDIEKAEEAVTKPTE